MSEAMEVSASGSGGLAEQPQNAPYRATQLWQEVIQGFRSGMPRRRKRLKMKMHEDCFTGGEAVEWLLVHLQATGLFGSVNRTQVEKLMQKFLESDVIQEVKGKLRKFDEDGSYLYRFVMEPGPLNFLDEPQSPLGKRGRSEASYDGTYITNEYAFMRGEEGESLGQPKRARNSVVSKLSVFDVNSHSASLSPAQVAGTWKELTLARLLCLVELPTLDGVIAHDAVDGKHIEQNVKLVAKFFMGRSSRQQKPQTPPHDAVTDVPQWVILAMKCLSKWPDGCTEEFVGGMPIYCGFELDVLQSLVQYFTSLPEPLISPKLYDLHLAVLSLIRERKPGASDALQLCSLLLPQTNRMRLHRVLRLINKASSNSELRLSRTHTNREVMLDHFSTVVLRPSAKGKCSDEERGSTQTLTAFMVQHYQHIFKVPDDLREQVQRRLQTMSQGKTDSPIAAGRSFCHRVSQKQYEEDAKAASRLAIGSLLNGIVADENMPVRVKKQRLKQFQKQYPEIYAEKFSSGKVKSASTSNHDASTVFSNPHHVPR